MKLSEKYPFPHSRYVVVRDGVVFTATPCYGMHSPWWVVRVMSDRYEDEPVPMLESDEWYPLAEFVSAQHGVHPTNGGLACRYCGFPNGEQVTHSCNPKPAISG